MADLALLVDDVPRVADGIELGPRTVEIARPGILFGRGASAGRRAIAAAGGILPAVGAVRQETIDVAAIFPARRVRQSPTGCAGSACAGTVSCRGCARAG